MKYDIRECLLAMFGSKTAKALIEKLGVENLSSINASVLMECGVAEKKAQQYEKMLALPSLLAEESYRRGIKVDAAERVFQKFSSYFAGIGVEEIWFVALDTKLRVVSEFLVSRGTVDSCVVDIAATMRMILRANQPNCIMVHNHPSGDCAPSRADDEVTARIREATKLLGVNLLDHVIVGKSYYSYAASGAIDTPPMPTMSRW